MAFSKGTISFSKSLQSSDSMIVGGRVIIVSKGVFTLKLARRFCKILKIYFLFGLEPGVLVGEAGWCFQIQIQSLKREVQAQLLSVLAQRMKARLRGPVPKEPVANLKGHRNVQ